MPAGVEPITLIPAVFIILAAGVVKGTTGFGFALVATPLLLLLWEPKTLVPVFIPLSIVADTFIVMQTWRQVEWGKVLPLVVTGVVGVPLGTYVLLVAPSETLRIAVAGIALTVATLVLLGITVPIRRERIASGVTGFLSGLLSTSTTMSGPPVVLLMINQGWNRQTFRACLGMFFFVLQLFAIASLTLAGSLTLQTLAVSAILWPSVIVGSALALLILPRISQRVFMRIAIVLVITTATVVIVETALQAAG